MRYGAIAASRRRASATATRFYGDPGVGNFWLGVAPQVSSIATHETKMGAPLALIRTYSTSNTPPWTSVDSIIAGGRIPWMSWLEGGFTNADIANGVQDAWIRGIAAEFKARAPWPLPWTFHHEPENDTNSSGANAAAYRGAQRQIKTIFRSEGVTNDIFICCNFMTPFTFNPTASGRDWRTWYPDWRNITGLGSSTAPDPNDFWKHGDPNSVVDAIGLDFYHGWDLAGLPGDTFAKWNTVTATNVWSTRLQPKIEFLNQPLAIGEWSTAAAQDGFTKDPNGDGTWTLTEYAADTGITYLPSQTDAWIDDYFTTLVAHGCFAFAWWDQRLTGANEVANNPLSVADPNETRWKRLGVWGNKPQAKLWTG
jgi:hypothetical protein